MEFHECLHGDPMEPEMKTRSKGVLCARGRLAETKTRPEAALGAGGGPVETTTAALEAGRPRQPRFTKNIAEFLN